MKINTEIMNNPNPCGKKIDIKNFPFIKKSEIGKNRNLSYDFDNINSSIKLNNLTFKEINDKKIENEINIPTTSIVNEEKINFSSKKVEQININSFDPEKHNKRLYFPDNVSNFSNEKENLNNQNFIPKSPRDKKKSHLNFETDFNFEKLINFDKNSSNNKNNNSLTTRNNNVNNLGFILNNDKNKINFPHEKNNSELFNLTKKNTNNITNSLIGKINNINININNISKMHLDKHLDFLESNLNHNTSNDKDIKNPQNKENIFYKTSENINTSNIMPNTSRNTPSKDTSCNIYKDNNSENLQNEKKSNTWILIKDHLKEEEFTIENNDNSNTENNSKINHFNFISKKSKASRLRTIKEEMEIDSFYQSNANEVDNSNNKIAYNQKNYKYLKCRVKSMNVMDFVKTKEDLDKININERCNTEEVESEETPRKRTENLHYSNKVFKVKGLSEYNKNTSLNFDRDKTPV